MHPDKEIDICDIFLYLRLLNISNQENLYIPTLVYVIISIVEKRQNTS